MKNNVFQLSHGIKSMPKEVVSMIYTLEKNFFAAATFKGLWDVSFQAE